MITVCVERFAQVRNESWRSKSLYGSDDRLLQSSLITILDNNTATPNDNLQQGTEVSSQSIRTRFCLCPKAGNEQKSSQSEGNVVSKGGKIHGLFDESFL
jgi:hypothetical protein